MGVHVREKKGYLYLDIYYKGRRHWESLYLKIRGLNPKDKKKAFNIAHKVRVIREQEIVSGAYGLSDTSNKKIILYDYAKKMSEKKGKKDALPKSLKYLKFFAKNIQIQAVNERWLESYIRYLNDHKDIGPSTVAKYFGAICQVFNNAERERIITFNPTRFVKKPKAPKPAPKFLSVDELQKLVNTQLKTPLGKEVCKSFLFSTRTGLRVSDLKTLIWDDIKIEEKVLYKKQQKTKDMVLVYLDEFSLSLIEKKEKHNGKDLVFPLLTRSKTNTNQYLNMWSKAAGVQHFGWHMARHTCATHLLNSGASPDTVQGILGHTKIQTTMIYAHLFDEKKKDAISMLPKLEY